MLLRFIVVAFLVQNGGQTVQALRDVRMVGALHLPSDAERFGDQGQRFIIQTQASIHVADDVHHGGADARLLTQFALHLVGASFQEVADSEGIRALRFRSEKRIGCRE